MQVTASSARRIKRITAERYLFDATLPLATHAIFGTSRQLVTRPLGPAISLNGCYGTLDRVYRISPP
jgi:hypothetical protein